MKRVASYAKQLVGAVEFLHAHGLCHLNISPNNVLLSHNGEVKLSDAMLSTAAIAVQHPLFSGEPGRLF